MSKLALLMGLNYRGTEAELNGCINDMENTKELLISVLKYNEENITLMTDDTEKKPTCNNIITQLIKMAERSYEEDVKEIWISYSGHGSYVHDQSEDEDDKKDECLVPLDYQESGLILDDTLNHALGLINPKTKIICIIDACHSETMLDLPYRYVSGNKNVIENKNCKVKSNCIMISGCRDFESSYDAYDINNSNEFSGAMTTSLLYVLETFGYTITCWRLLKEMRRFLKKKGFPQIPQISCTKKLRSGTLFMCINPNPYVSEL